MGFFGSVVKSVGHGFSNAAKAVSHVATEVAHEAGQVAKAVGHVATEVAESTFEAGKKVGQGVATAAESTFEASKKAGQKLGQGVTSVARNTASTVSNVYTHMEGVAGKALAQAAKMDKAAAGTKLLSRGIFSKVGNFLGAQVLRTVADKTPGLFGAVKGSLLGIPAAVYGTVTNIKQAVQSGDARTMWDHLSVAAKNVLSIGPTLHSVVEGLLNTKAAKLAAQGLDAAQPLLSAGGKSARELMALGKFGQGLKLGSSFSKGLGKLVPGMNVAMAGMDVAHFGLTMANSKAPLGKKILAGFTAAFSLVGATNIPIVSQVGGLLSVGTGLAESTFYANQKYGVYA